MGCESLQCAFGVLKLIVNKARPDEGNHELCQNAKVMLEKILEAILDPQPTTPSQGVLPAPEDPLSWIDDVFGDGWMVHGPFGDGTGMDHASMYSNNMDWLLPV